MAMVWVCVAGPHASSDLNLDRQRFWYTKFNLPTQFPRVTHFDSFNIWRHNLDWTTHVPVVPRKPSSSVVMHCVGPWLCWAV